MERKGFLKGVGLAGFASLIPFKSVWAAASEEESPLADCTLIPSETEGPYPLDLTANTAFFRSDILEGKTGVPFYLKIKVLGTDNCGALSNVRVNIWHCDKDGNYSGYGTEVGKTYLRGYQITDANGEVSFTTIFPGWYESRVCHIHFQVYVSSSYSVISQMAFDDTTKNGIYAANSALYTKGADPLSVTRDSIFSSGGDYKLQMCTLTANTDGSYNGEIVVAVKGSGTLGVGYYETKNAKRFSMGQLFPNPTNADAYLPITLYGNAEVLCTLYDINGREVGVAVRDQLAAGTHDLHLEIDKLSLPPGNYAYNVKGITTEGVFGEARVLTIQR